MSNPNLLYRRYQNAALHLQREAYRQQMQGRTKPLKHFSPCARGLVFTAACAPAWKGERLSVQTEIVYEALMTPCACHTTITESDIWDFVLEIKD